MRMMESRDEDRYKTTPGWRNGKRSVAVWFTSVVVVVAAVVETFAGNRICRNLNARHKQKGSVIIILDAGVHHHSWQKQGQKVITPPSGAWRQSQNITAQTEMSNLSSSKQSKARLKRAKESLKVKKQIKEEYSAKQREQNKREKARESAERGEQRRARHSFEGAFTNHALFVVFVYFSPNSSRRTHFPRFSFLPVRALTFRTRDANSPPLPFAWHYQTQPATDSNWRQQLESKAKRKICPDWRLIVLTGCEAAGVADFLFQFTRITDWSRRCVCVCECFQGRLESALFFFSETVISVSISRFEVKQRPPLFFFFFVCCWPIDTCNIHVRHCVYDCMHSLFIASSLSVAWAPLFIHSFT